jgi:Toprim-like
MGHVLTLPRNHEYYKSRVTSSLGTGVSSFVTSTKALQAGRLARNLNSSPRPRHNPQCDQRWSLACFLPLPIFSFTMTAHRLMRLRRALQPLPASAIYYDLPRRINSRHLGSIAAMGTPSLHPLPLNPVLLPANVGNGSPAPPRHHMHHFGRQQERPPFTVATRNHSVFVSKYASFSLTSKDILDYCEHVGVAACAAARTTPTHVVLRECPFCPKPTNDKPDNLYKLYLQVGRGAYFCHRCGAKGSWLDFKGKLGKGNYETSSTHVHAADPFVRSKQRSAAGGSNSASLRGSAARKGGKGSGAAAQNTGGFDDGGFLVPASTRPHTVPCLPMPSQRLQALYCNNLLAEDADDLSSVLRYLTAERGLDVKTLRKYGVGKAAYQFADETGTYRAHDCVTFSWIMSHDDVRIQEELRGAVYESGNDRPTTSADVAETKPSAEGGEAAAPPAAPAPSPSPSGFVTRRIKARALASKAYQRLDPPGGAWGFFGYHTVPADAKEVVLTEGEYDAMAVYQATGRPAISLPNGCRSLPVSALPLLERFERVYLWMDNDGPGQEGAEAFAKKIGLERCYIVRPTPLNCPDKAELPKDANDALRMNCDLDRIIETSKLTPHERILSFDDLRHEVLHEILHPEQYVGLPLPSLPTFTKIVRGLRRGELWVVTGTYAYAPPHLV